MDEMEDAKWMALAVEEATKCEPILTGYSVGAVLVLKKSLVSSGHSRQEPGNTHAEQVCLMNQDAYDCTLYTTMEPCGLRLSGNPSCASLILKSGIVRVVVGIREPDVFVKSCTGTDELRNAGIQVDYLTGFEASCLKPNAHLIK